MTTILSDLGEIGYQHSIEAPAGILGGKEFANSPHNDRGKMDSYLTSGGGILAKNKMEQREVHA
jgi:hypothetical protein